MTEYEIIVEMHIVAKNINRLKKRLNELKEKLYKRDEFQEYLKSLYSRDNASTDTDENKEMENGSNI